MLAVLLRRLNAARSPLRLLLFAGLTGILAGVTCVSLDGLSSWLLRSRMEWFSCLSGWAQPIAAALLGALLGAVAIFLVRRFAPETSGSGVPEIEGALLGVRPMRWRRVLPVKFIAGVSALGSGMILGTEGPSIQIGGALGAMLAETGKLSASERHALLAAGAAAGLAAAFNAPLAGILFVLEELRSEFRHSFLAINAVILAVIMATLMRHLLVGNSQLLNLPLFASPQPLALPLFALLGVIMGVIGCSFNRGVTLFQDGFLRLHGNHLPRVILLGALLGGGFGLLSLAGGGLTGSGLGDISSWVVGTHASSLLFVLLLWRLLATLLCFCSGVPGGVFAPSLAIGTLCGASFGHLFAEHWPVLAIEPGVFAIAGMGALFASSIGAPVTGIILIVEMSNNYTLILPLLITTLSATLTAKALDGQPLYSQMLERSLCLARTGSTNTAKPQRINTINGL